MRPLTRYALLLLLALSLCAVALVPACGGCPWIETSAVSVTPTASCLELSVANGSGDAPSTGCVDPVLYGVNRCSQPLVLPADPAYDGGGQRVEPNQSFTYEIRLNHCDAVGQDYHAKVPATLGTTNVLIEFDLYAP